VGTGGRGGASEVAGAGPSGGIAGGSGGVAGAAGAAGTTVAAAGASSCTNACDPGDPEVPPGGACAPYSCYTRALCGEEITCVNCKAPSVSRHYAAYGECALAEIECPDQTLPFRDDCGCGCAQDPSCPDQINCLAADPLCSAEGLAKCPYSGIEI